MSSKISLGFLPSFWAWFLTAGWLAICFGTVSNAASAIISDIDVTNLELITEYYLLTRINQTKPLNSAETVTTYENIIYL